MKHWNEAENPYHRPGLLNPVKHERATNLGFETCDTAGSVQAILMTPSFILSRGAPSLALPNLTTDRTNNYQLIGDSQSMFGFLKRDHDPYVQQWSLFVEHQFSSNLSVNAGYVGSHGLHLLTEEIRNLDCVPTTVQQIRGNINNSTYPVNNSLNGHWGCQLDSTVNQTLCQG